MCENVPVCAIHALCPRAAVVSWVFTDVDLDVMLGEVVVFLHSLRDRQGEIGLGGGAHQLPPESGRGIAPNL